MINAARLAELLFMGVVEVTAPDDEKRLIDEIERLIDEIVEALKAARDGRTGATLTNDEHKYLSHMIETLE